MSSTDERARLTEISVVALFGVVAVVLADPGPTTFVAGAALAIALAGLAALRLEGWPQALGILACGALLTVILHGQTSNVGWFGVCALAALAGSSLDPRPAAAVTAAGVAMFAWQWSLLPEDPGWGAWVAGTVFSAVAAGLVRRQIRLVEQLREAQAGLAQRAAAEERNRIAHELHDVIGHALTVSLLHIGSARLALAEDPVETDRALAEAERLAQQSLADVRAVVGMMRDPTGATPLPGVDQLGDLLESFRRAGSQVDWQVEGDLTALSPTKGLTLYRILQEALTNATRHAPGLPARVSVSAGPDGTRLRVDNAAPDERPEGRGPGAGLIGMRERAEAVGGRFSAGPGPDGWRVEAVLP